MTEMTLDTMDKRILDIIQTDLPVESRPYAIIAERLGITEQEAPVSYTQLSAPTAIRLFSDKGMAGGGTFLKKGFLSRPLFQRLSTSGEMCIRDSC